MRKISHVGFLSCAVHNMNDCFTLNDNDFIHLHEHNTVVILNREGCIEMILRVHYWWLPLYGMFYCIFLSGSTASCQVVVVMWINCHFPQTRRCGSYSILTWWQRLPTPTYTSYVTQDRNIKIKKYTLVFCQQCVKPSTLCHRRSPCNSKNITFAEFKQNGRSCLIFFENKIKSGGPWCKFLDIPKNVWNSS